MQELYFQEAISFDDVLLVPKYSQIESRSCIDLSVTLRKRDNSFNFSMPIIPANMKTVTGEVMARYIARKGGLAVLHRFMTVEDQVSVLRGALSENKDYSSNIGMSIGVKPEDTDIVDRFVCNGAKILCLDVAHAHSLASIKMCEYISSNYKDVLLIAGNVATAEAAEKLWLSGADVVKVGIGSGSICTTRIETGNGVPQLSAIIDVGLSRTKTQKKVIGRDLYMISDGGIKIPADICKALCFSDMVMAGNIFAGTDEAPGDIVDVDGHAYKSYVGSSTHKDSRKEGVEALVPYKGSAEKVLTRFLEGLQSCCSYQGVSKVKDLQVDPKFVRITSSGLIESHPHDVRLKK